MNGGKILLCGNGDSAADTEHIAGELMKGFRLKRKIRNETLLKLKSLYPPEWKYFYVNLQEALPAISMVNSVCLSRAISKDLDPGMILGQQVYGYGKSADVITGISISGTAVNVLSAFKIACALFLYKPLWLCS